MDSDRARLELLRPSVDALRRALARMDGDDIPASLRKAAVSSARRLPPPLLRRAVDELDESEWLRAEALAEWGAPDVAGDLFLNRPSGWTDRLEELVAEEADRTRTKVTQRTERQLDDARRRIAELEARLEDASTEASAAETRAVQRLRSQVESSERGRRRAEEQSRDEARRYAQANARAERAAAELEVVHGRVESLRQLLARERRAAAASPSDTGQGRRGWFPSDPAEMATELDRIVTATRRQPRSRPGASPTTSALRLPDGIRPDRPEAVRWLMGRALTWLVDGYNLAFAIDDHPDSATRSRLVAAAGQLVGLSAPGTMGVVVFDSSVDTSSMVTDRRVRVVFAPSADEWILDQAGEGKVVVSSDRRVREGAESAGAIGLWSEAMAGWIEEPAR